MSGRRAERACPFCSTLFRPKSSRKTECCSRECAGRLGLVTRYPKGLDRSWMVHAACADVDPALFFPERGESNAAAVTICRACPVRFECLEYALSAGEKHGVWGGMSERERRKLRAYRTKATAA